MGFDEELNELLERLAHRYISRSLTQPCCREPPPVGLEVRSWNEIQGIMRKCRVLFVNFYSTYCPYCRIFHRVFIDVGRMYRGRAGFVMINVEHDPETAWRYNIMSTPTTIAFIDGEPATMIPGYVPHHVFQSIVERVLEKAGCIQAAN